jgi:type I restriction enzyme, S subunit
MEIKDGYKKSEVGIIPQEWKCLRVEECVSIKTGSMNTEDKINNGMYPFFVRSQQVERINSFSFDCEAVLTAGDGVGTGKVFHYINGKFDVHQRVYVMYDFKNIIGQYFYNYFSSFFYDEVCKYTAKSSVDSVRRDMIAKMLLPIPTLTEQQAIATALSDIDGIINSLAKLIAKKKNIKQGAIQELLTGRTRLPGYSEEWNRVSLKQIILDFIVPMRDKPKDLNGEIPWCRIEDFEGKYLSESKSGQGVSKDTINTMSLKICPVGTLLVSCSAYLGRCAIVKRELITNQTFIGLFPSNQVNVEYLYYVMMMEEHNLNELSSGTTISYLSREQFENYKIRIPLYKEQTAIADLLSDLDSEIELLEKKLYKYKNIRQGMLQKLLTGEIRLV